MANCGVHRQALPDAAPEREPELSAAYDEHMVNVKLYWGETGAPP
jgi:hypothetical protein